MPKSKEIVLLLASILLLSTATAQVTMESGTIFDPVNSNAEYSTAQDMKFSQLTVYNDRVNFSYTNVSTDATLAVNVSMWSHNFSKSSGEVAHYHYNQSAETSFYRLNPDKSYKVLFNGSEDRVVSSQEYLNVTVDQDTNLTIQKSDSFNSAPSAPSAPNPSDGSTNADYDTTLSVDVTDPDGDSMDVRFWDGNGNLIGTDSAVPDEGTASVTWSNRNPGTSYSWKAEADDGETSVNSSTWSFTTNYEVQAQSQFFDETSVNHEYEVEGYANDTDGESDIGSCEIYYEDSDGNSGTVSGTILNDNNGDDQVKCSRNISNSISDIEVGETVSTLVRFDDGESTSETSMSSYTVPNNAPTGPDSFTDLSNYLTDHTPEVQWSGEDDPDGDEMYITAYTGESSSPTTNDTSKDASSTSMNIGQSVSLQDGTDYYYRLKLCDEYGACASYTSNDDFGMNEEPEITSYQSNNSDPNINDTVEIDADVSDENLQSVNFTVLEDGDVIIDNQKGTNNSGTWTSPEFVTDERAYYNYTIEATDNVSEAGLAQGTLSIGYEQEGTYTRTFTTTENVTEIKAEVYGDLNGGSMSLEANTSTSGSSQIENGTWYNIGSGKDITFTINLQGDGTSTPEVQGYDIDYRTSYKNSGEYLSKPQDIPVERALTSLTIDEKEPVSTSADYEIRVGNTTNPDGSWSGWKQCSDSCDLSVSESDYFQFRVNLQGTDFETPEVNSIEVDY